MNTSSLYKRHTYKKAVSLAFYFHFFVNSQKILFLGLEKSNM